jgi:hypothetical protein
MIFAMKINIKIGFCLFAFLTTLFLGCTKEVILIEPDPVCHARVLNTDIPVPYARLAYLKSNEDGFLGGETFTVLKRDTADANGNFTIDYSIDADYIAARYDSIIYDYSYEENYLNLNDLSRSENLSTIPGYGWVGVTCLDVEPLNPEITDVALTIGGAFDFYLSEGVPVYQRVSSYEEMGLGFKLFENSTLADFKWEAHSFSFNDTTFVVFKY